MTTRSIRYVPAVVVTVVVTEIEPKAVLRDLRRYVSCRPSLAFFSVAGRRSYRGGRGFTPFSSGSSSRTRAAAAVVWWPVEVAEGRALVENVCLPGAYADRIRVSTKIDTSRSLKVVKDRKETWITEKGGDGRGTGRYEQRPATYRQSPSSRGRFRFSRSCPRSIRVQDKTDGVIPS